MKNLVLPTKDTKPDGMNELIRKMRKENANLRKANREMNERLYYHRISSTGWAYPEPMEMVKRHCVQRDRALAGLHGVKDEWSRDATVRERCANMYVMATETIRALEENA